MMRLKKVDRLIAVSVLSAVLMVWLLLVGLDAFFTFIGNIGDVGKGNYGLSSAVIQVLLTVPRRAYESFIHAALIGSLLGLGTLAATGELTALRAAGMSKLRICVSVGIALGALIFVVALIGETAAPAGDQRAQQLEMQAKSNDITLARGSGLWARDGETFINAKQGTTRQTPQGRLVQLSDVRVFEFAPGGLLRSIAVAKRAEHRLGAWTMHEVRRTVFDGASAKSTNEATAQWASGLDPRMLALSIVHPEYLSTRDLSRSINYLKRNNQDAQTFEVAYWARVFWPLNVLLLVLCALPFAFGTLRTGGLGKRIFVGIVVAMIWYFMQRALVSLGAVYGINLAVANLIPALVLVAGAWIYFRRAS